MSKKLISTFSIFIGVLIFSNYSYANQNYSSPSIESTDVFSISENSVVLLDHTNNKADLIDLKTNKITRISDDASPILDLKIIKKPQKIVLLKKVNNTKISKTVISYNGNVLTKTEIPLNHTGDKIKWVAPTEKVNERIMVQSGNSFNLYQYPWKRPSVSYNAIIVDKSYESVSVQDWDFEGYPNLAIEYMAQGIMSEDFFVKTANLYTKKEFFFKSFNTDIHLKYSGDNLALFTSYPYQPVPANANRPIAANSQPFFQLINNLSGIKSTTLEGIFKEEGDISGWQTEFINNQIFIGDLAEHTWSLYSQNGDLILKNQVWPKNSTTKFLNYSSNSQTAYFLDYVSDKASITPYSINKD